MTLEQQWLKYRNACYPNGIPSLQESEIRQAFFAASMVVLCDVFESVNKLTEDEAVKHLENLMDEAETVCSQRCHQLRSRN